jgi:hypothetical protein
MGIKVKRCRLQKQKEKKKGGSIGIPKMNGRRQNKWQPRAIYKRN